jgi:hypothetical protein
MNILKITFLIGAFLFGLKEVKSQNTISLSQQQEDFKVFKTGIDEMQVGTDWFITPVRFNELCDSVYNSLTDNDNIFTFSNKLRFCLASLKAAHNGINLPDGVVWTKTITLPFILRYIDEQLIIKVNCSPNQSIPSGSEIISINGRPVKEYTNELNDMEELIKKENEVLSKCKNCLHMTYENLYYNNGLKKIEEYLNTSMILKLDNSKKYRNGKRNSIV